MLKLIDTVVQIVDKVRLRAAELISGHVTIELTLPLLYSRNCLVDLIAKKAEEVFKVADPEIVRMRFNRHDESDESLPGFPLSDIADDFLKDDTLKKYPHLLVAAIGDELEVTRYAA